MNSDTALFWVIVLLIITAIWVVIHQDNKSQGSDGTCIVYIAGYKGTLTPIFYPCKNGF